MKLIFDRCVSTWTHQLPLFLDSIRFMVFVPEAYFSSVLPKIIKILYRLCWGNFLTLIWVKILHCYGLIIMQLNVIHLVVHLRIA